MTLISLSFSSLPAIVLAPVLWAIIAATVIVAIARRMDAAPRLRLTRVAVVALVCATLLIAVCARYPDLDECEHLHTAWLMAQGQLPFRDFFQHHTPTFWLVLAPIMRLLPPSGNVLLWARLLALALGALAWYLGYRLARRLHAAIHPALAPMMVVLACGATMSGEFFILRPDLVSNVLSLLGLGVVWKRADALRAALSGLLLGLSLSFNPKHWPMVAVVPVLALTSGAGLASGLGISLAHAVGVALGLTPMVAWLATQGLLGPFVEWVGRFNSELGPVPGGPLPLVSVAMSVAWAVRVRANHWRALDHPTRLMATSLVGSAAIGLLYGPAMLKGSTTCRSSSSWPARRGRWRPRASSPGQSRPGVAGSPASVSWSVCSLWFAGPCCCPRATCSRPAARSAFYNRWPTATRCSACPRETPFSPLTPPTCSSRGSGSTSCASLRLPSACATLMSRSWPGAR